MSRVENGLAMEDRSQRQNVRSAALWAGLLGGGVAWTLHLVLAYIIAEFGCISGLDRAQFLGISAVAWLLLGLSVAMLLGAGAVTWFTYRTTRRLAALRGETLASEADFEMYMARAGYITSGSFFLIILAQTLPIFFYLRTC
jgi:hypothetical protein